VIGLVGVMELVNAAAGKEGGKGWRTFFKGAMDARGDQDVSDTASNRSAGVSVAGTMKSKVSKRMNIAPAPKKRNARPVSKLRPKAPLVVLDSTFLQDLAEMMATNRMDAALLVSDDGRLSGIITDNDFTRRIVAVYLNTAENRVCSVMTQNPKCVRAEDSALEALEMMVDNRFRHLPVLDKDGAVVGLLDIAKCLYDAISVLEKVHDEEGAGEGDANAMLMGEAMATAMKKVAGSRGTNKAQLKAMTALMEQMFGGAVPTLREIIADHQMVVVRPTANVREAATIMAEARKGVLVMDEDELVGILTPKDVLSRVIAARKSPDLTSVSSVMTPNPDCVDASITVIDALRDMYDHKYLHLPVRDEYGRVIGLVDVMELVTHSAGGGSQGGKGWKALLSDAMEAPVDDLLSDNASAYSVPMSLIKPANGKNKPRIRASYLDELPPQPIHQPDDSSDVFSVSAGLKHLASAQSAYNNSNYDSASVLFTSDFVYKIVCKDGHIHRIKSSSDSLDTLKATVAEKLQVTVGADATEDVVLKYVDDDKDEVIISTDVALRDAVEFARSSGLSTLKLSAYVVSKAAKAKEAGSFSFFQGLDKKKMTMYVGSGLAAAATFAAIGAFVFIRNKN
jgi:CBS domain-containing protein